MAARWMRWHRALSEFGARIATVCVAIMAIAYTAEVVARYFFSAPLNWSGDLSGYLLCVSVFLALPKVTADRAHVAVSLVVEVMHGQKRRIYLRILWYVTAVVCAFITYFIAVEGVRQFNEHILTSAANQIPKWWISAVACYGLASAALHLLYAEPELASGEGVQ
jgi:TRAP-type C4-dicarboxylate transport system permease small subunit